MFYSRIDSFILKVIYLLLPVWVFITVGRLSLVVALRFLCALASLVAQCGLQGLWAAAVVVHGLSCSEDGGSSQTGSALFPTLARIVSTTGPPGNSQTSSS